MSRRPRRVRSWLTWLFILVFLFTGIQPTPAFAAEAAGSWLSQAGARLLQSDTDVYQSFTGLGSLAAVTGAGNKEQGLWEEFVGLFTSDDEKSADRGLARVEKTPTGKKLPDPKREKELVGKRTANSKVYELEDGRQQAEISTAPLHYRDSNGEWREIDPAVESSEESDFSFASKKNSFHSLFGNKKSKLVEFRYNKRKITLGLDGEGDDKTSPQAEGNQVIYTGVLNGADLKYTVTADSLKEEIVLDRAPEDPTYTFTLKMGGVEAEERKDGSIAFNDPAEQTLFVMPAPFMTDSEDDPESPYGKRTSGKVTQTVEKKGSTFTITVKADKEWLADSSRKYPVTIDPTVTIQPTTSQSKDAYIMSGLPTSNFGAEKYVSVGTTSGSKARGLVEFDLSSIPQGTPIDSAQLGMYYDQTHTTNANAVGMEVRGINQDWDETSVTWDDAKTGQPWTTAGGSIDSGVPYNRETVDNNDVNNKGDQAFENGAWTTSTSIAGYHGTDYQYNGPNNPGEGATFTWVPFLTESGSYLVEARYQSYTDRATDAPYTVHHSGGQTTKDVKPANQRQHVVRPRHLEL